MAILQEYPLILTGHSLISCFMTAGRRLEASVPWATQYVEIQINPTIPHSFGKIVLTLRERT